LTKTFGKTTATRTIPDNIDIPKANGSAAESYFDDAFAASPQSQQHSPVQISEMEAELRTISAELATSIRREMELEDLVERLQGELDNPRAPGKRTSDYFSDSGTSSVRYGGDMDAKSEEMEKLQRKTEREKAQVRLDCQAKMQEERDRRKSLEKQIRLLEEKVSHADLAEINTLDATGRFKELESTCEDLRRRLNEEKMMKENFEDLLTALKAQLLDSHNERDNLRDEVVPQLRARVEGLEAQAAEYEKLTYENSKMAQEMQALQKENALLQTTKRLQTDIPPVHMDSIGEDMDGLSALRDNSNGLKRSSSVVHSSRTPATPTIRSRPTSMTFNKGVVVESRDMLIERVKDVEAQRDALHRALKSLLERQEHQNRENAKKLRQLELERDRALNLSPKRKGYDHGVKSLRGEINALRRRADEACEQKWQCEKNLAGLKMDLDRAEQEVRSLRSLLSENDIEISEDISKSTDVSGEALEKAYRGLKKSYAESLARIKELEDSIPDDEATQKALVDLQRSLEAVISERDSARQGAEAFRDSVSSYYGSEKQHLATETALAEELRASATRVEELASQVRAQMASNAQLRQRLTETIERGEREQTANKSRIVAMQARLRESEEALYGAQQTTEERIARHEDEVAGLRETRGAGGLNRSRDVGSGGGSKSTTVFRDGAAPVASFMSGTRSPRLEVRSLEEQIDVPGLRKRVEELERALIEAEREMEEVVGRMNGAQMEVAELESAREHVVRENRRLMGVLEAERLKSFEERFRSFQT
jgi:chromosome segregation ATPase